MGSFLERSMRFAPARGEAFKRAKEPDRLLASPATTRGILFLSRRWARGRIQPRSSSQICPLLQPISQFRVSDSPSRLPETTLLRTTEQRFPTSGKRCSASSPRGDSSRGKVPEEMYIARRSAPRLVVPAANAVSAAAPRPLPITPIPVLGTTLQLARTLRQISQLSRDPGDRTDRTRRCPPYRGATNFPMRSERCRGNLGGRLLIRGGGRVTGRGGRSWHRGDVATQIRPTATAREPIAGEGHQGPLMTAHEAKQPLHHATPPHPTLMGAMTDGKPCPSRIGPGSTISLREC